MCEWVQSVYRECEWFNSYDCGNLTGMCDGVGWGGAGFGVGDHCVRVFYHVTGTRTGGRSRRKEGTGIRPSREDGKKAWTSNIRNWGRFKRIKK